MTPMLAVAGVSKRYGKMRVLDDVTFEVGRGEVVGVIGPNGAGKTTLLRLIVGLLRSHRGEVRLDGGVVPHVLARVRVSYFAGEHTVPGTVRINRWRALFHPIEEATDRRRARTLSRGTRQLAGLQTLFASAPARLIVLDEPWEGLDPDASRWLTASIRGRSDAGTTVLVSSHRLHDLAGVCDRYLFLHNGTVTTVGAYELDQRSTVTGESLLAMFDRVRTRANS